MRFLFLALGFSVLFFQAFFQSAEATENPCADQTKAVNNITCPGYKIFLSNIDPVGSGNSISGGKEAATTLLEKIASLLLFLIPILGGVSLIIAGYYYILSSGDSEKANQAKTIIKWNLVAILVAVFSYSLIILLAKLLG